MDGCRQPAPSDVLSVSLSRDVEHHADVTLRVADKDVTFQVTEKWLPCAKLGRQSRCTLPTMSEPLSQNSKFVHISLFSKTDREGHEREINQERCSLESFGRPD